MWKPTKTRQYGLYPNDRVADPKVFASGRERYLVHLIDYYVSQLPLDMLNSGRFSLTHKQI